MPAKTKVGIGMGVVGGLVIIARLGYLWWRKGSVKETRGTIPYYPDSEEAREGEHFRNSTRGPPGGPTRAIELSDNVQGGNEKSTAHWNYRPVELEG
jgi:hypothetical protein